MYIIIIYSIICALLFYASLTFLIKRLKRNTATDTSNEVSEINEKIKKFDEGIEKASSYANALLPLEEALTRREKETELNKELKKHLDALGKLEKSLQDIKFEVEETEREYNEIKKGKESSNELNDKIKSEKSKLKSEAEGLQNKLTESITNLTTITGEVKLNQNQESGFNAIISGIKNANEQLSNLLQTYGQTSGRFQNLNAQFKDLEMEFSKLVEKELNN